MTSDLVTATSQYQFVPGVTLTFNFSFVPSRPWNGLTFYARFYDPERKLVAGIIDGINTLFDTGTLHSMHKRILISNFLKTATQQVENARRALAQAVVKLQEARATLARAQKVVDSAFGPAIRAVHVAQARCNR